MSENYQIVYFDAENVGIIGILAYPRIAAQNDKLYITRDCSVIRQRKPTLCKTLCETNIN